MTASHRLNPRNARLWVVLTALLAAAAIAALVVLHSGSASAPATTPAEASSGPARATVAVLAGHGGPRFDDGALGLSLETEELATGNLTAEDGTLVSLMRLLGPSVLRLGGNSLDLSWWTTSLETPPPWATSAITPPDLKALRNLLDASGWKVVLGVNLGHYAPLRAASEVRSAHAILGDRLIGIEVGNEPDSYGDPRKKLRSPSYDAAAYLRQLGHYVRAIRHVSPAIPIYGPDLSEDQWMKGLTSSPSATPFDRITYHYYPTTYNVSEGACAGTPVPPAAELLSPKIEEWQDYALQNLDAAGARAQRPVEISETNSTGSCDTSGGPKTSPVFASAVWALDWSLRAASSGVSRLSFHGHLGLCGPDTVSPVCASTPAAAEERRVSARPEFYGLLAASQLQNGSFVPVRTSESGGARISAYATAHGDGSLTLALINLSPSKTARADVSLPGRHLVTVAPLAAPALTSRSNVSFADASVGRAGGWEPRPKPARIFASELRQNVPHGSALILTIAPDHDGTP